MGHRRKKRTHAELDESSLRRIPRSMVFKIGSVTKSVKKLSRDIRRMVLPWTASNLEERKKASIKDYLHVGGMLHISHMWAMSQPKVGVRLTICRTKGGEGPTGVFDVVNYALSADVRRTQFQSRSTLNDFKQPPIMVTQGFKKPIDNNVHPDQLAKVSLLFASMFPAVSASETPTRRLVIVCYAGARTFDIRHYVVLNNHARNHARTQRNNVRTKRQKLERPKQEVKEELLEEDDDHKKQLANQMELIELGPRLTLQLAQVHDGVFNNIKLSQEVLSPEVPTNNSSDAVVADTQVADDHSSDSDHHSHPSDDDHSGDADGSGDDHFDDNDSDEDHSGGDDDHSSADSADDGASTVDQSNSGCDE
ncbi:brix domain protein [Gregarina niphandrodes]|uniref:Brix domain protein n=1 Tax=Gregarina niphandrodes TaxID=110365 RepID=A0A023B0G1_GRENI|nr:brix domain protein [Gregarina niphandrodes]EZG44195.1 brix domain protein [Gregarina niphandrodes]|eukprot:XP_011132763.1 brix domain protein [Gregarina niphandrodes]